MTDLHSYLWQESMAGQFLCLIGYFGIGIVLISVNWPAIWNDPDTRPRGLRDVMVHLGMAVLAVVFWLPIAIYSCWPKWVNDWKRTLTRIRNLFR